MQFKEAKPSTLAVHAGEHDHILGSVSLPIFQSSTYINTGNEEYKDIRYIRLNNTPNHVALHEKIASLEAGEAALVTASGMAAISTTLLSVLKSGDHFLAQNCLYGGTYGFLHDDAHDLGWNYDYIDPNNAAAWEKSLKPNTKAIYVESISNPLVQVGNLPAIVAFAKRHNLVSIIDNTFASPINFQPLRLGFDLSVHSCTKYMNGHSDLVAGCVVGKQGWIEKINYKLIHFGGSLDPHTCFLLNRGLKTLPLRMRCHNENALELAKFLARHPKVEKINYPGLEGHANYARAKELFTGFGGVLSFELKCDQRETLAHLKKLQIPAFAPSLGGTETLITLPVQTSHKSVPAEERLRIGISDKLVRVSLGIEDSEDIIRDFQQALG